MVTNREANRLRLCLGCGSPDAHLLRTSDDRNVRACDNCLSRADGASSWAAGGVPREPLPSELRGGPVQHDIQFGGAR